MEEGKNCIETVLFGTICDNCNGEAIYRLIKLIIAVMTAGIGILAILGIIIAGIVYLTSGDNAAKMQKAKRRILEIVIGLAAYAALFAILQFVIPGRIVELGDGTCVEAPVSQNPSDGSTDKYPMATVAGKASPGNIVCPRNANYTYIENPKHENGWSFDKWFRSQAVSCPFTAVVYSDNAEDEKCAPGDTMHYDAEKGWCLINSKIDVYQYKAYLDNNYIRQDGQTCLTDGSECSNGDHLSDLGECMYFSYAFASNLNNGEAVSNDAYAGMAGIASYYGFSGFTNYGNKMMTSASGVMAAVYNDSLTGIYTTGTGIPIPRGYDGLKTDGTSAALKGLSAGYAVPLGVHNTRNTSGNCGHFLVAIGYTMDCADGECWSGSLVVLNTNGAINTLGNTNFVIGYDRCGH